MKPVIVAKSVINGLKMRRALREYAALQLDLALNRVRHNIRAVAVHISDENGPKGGADKRCLIKLSKPGLPDIVVTKQDRR